jgi:hypothetical protein
MTGMMRNAICAICAAATLVCLSCSKEKIKPDGGNEIPLSELDIEQKFLAEGFITNDLYRVVIVSPKDAAQDAGALRTRASNRARVSLERSLSAENIECDRAVKTAVLNLIERSGQLVQKEIGSTRYSVYYFDITRKNIRGYFKNVSSQR